MNHQYDQLEALAKLAGVTVYNICHRNAGWGVQWYEQERQGSSKDFHEGLVVYGYYSTFPEMISGEINRLSSL